MCLLRGTLQDHVRVEEGGEEAGQLDAWGPSAGDVDGDGKEQLHWPWRWG